jgi:hypothetical protein
MPVGMSILVVGARHEPGEPGLAPGVAHAGMQAASDQG